MNKTISLSDVSIVIPAKNEALGLNEFLPRLVEIAKGSEIILVNDGSTDNTADIAAQYGLKVVSHPYSKGNGAAIKTGARAATGEVVVFMDGDGQHNPEDIPRLLEQMNSGYDMVVGARNNASQASFSRFAGNKLYNRLATFMVDRKVEDLTSGFRAVDRKKFIEFLYLLPNGFSYPTTITMSFFRAGYSVSYLPIVANKREGSSHISLVRDGIKFLLIIFKVGTLYSPLKIFFPMASFFLLSGIFYYLYTLISFGRFTNMSMLLLVTSVIIFLIGLVSEQITSLMYKDVGG